MKFKEDPSTHDPDWGIGAVCRKPWSVARVIVDHLQQKPLVLRVGVNDYSTPFTLRQNLKLGA